MKFPFAKILLIICSLFVSLNASDDKPFASEGRLRFIVDIAQFMENEKENRVEFSIILYSDQLLESQNKNTVEYEAELLITNESFKTGRTWKTEANIAKKSESNFNSLVINDSWSEIIPIGSYSFKINIKDLNGSSEGICSGIITKQLFTEMPVTASSIKFFTGRENENSKLEMQTHASRQYGLLNPVVYVYYELYKNTNDKLDESEINYIIKNNRGEILKTFPSKKQSIVDNKIKIINALNVSSIPSGIYDLEAVVNSNYKEILKLNRQFEVIQFDKSLNTDFEINSVIEFSKNILPYIASEKETNKYELLNEKGKIEFILEFWEDHDTDKNPLQNETLTDYYKKYLYANENFSWGGIEGWKSDRGRVLIKYGIPDEIINFFSEENVNPYMVWKYEKDRLYEFIFGDLRGDGRFSLIHSNKESEVSNPYWRNNLVKAK